MLCLLHNHHSVDWFTSAIFLLLLFSLSLSLSSSSFTSGASFWFFNCSHSLRSVSLPPLSLSSAFSLFISIHALLIFLLSLSIPSFITPFTLFTDWNPCKKKSHLAKNHHRDAWPSSSSISLFLDNSYSWIVVPLTHGHIWHENPKSYAQQPKSVLNTIDAKSHSDDWFCKSNRCGWM